MTHTYIGSSILRSEDSRLIAGAGMYVDDIKISGMAHMAVLRSPHAHASIKSIDSTSAADLDGAIKVFTFEDLGPNPKHVPMRLVPLPGLEHYLQFPLAREKVRYVGEPVAVVVARSRYIAEDMLDVIRVDYEPLPAVVDVLEALKDNVLLHDDTGTNLAAKLFRSRGDVLSALRDSDYSRRDVFQTNRHTGMPMETRGLVADYIAESGEMKVWGPTKVPHFNRDVLALMLPMPKEKIHFFEPDVGGGFGVRGEFYPEDFLVPFVSRHLGRPIKWIEDRREHMMAANHSRQVRIELEMGFKKDGTITAMRSRLYSDIGAYTRTHGGLVPTHTAKLLLGPYRIHAYDSTTLLAVTNKMGIGTYRAPGSFESCFARERLLDMAADDLGLDPADIRSRNLLEPAEMPYNTGFDVMEGDPLIYDSANYISAFSKALDSINYNEIKALQGKLDNGKYHGIGIANFVKVSGLGPFENAKIVLKGPSEVLVYLGIASLGQGHKTTMAQICADGLGVPFETITIFNGSTDHIEEGVGTFGGRATALGGSALYIASRKLKTRLLGIASNELKVPLSELNMTDGSIYRTIKNGHKLVINLEDVMSLAKELGEYDEDEGGILERGRFEVNHSTCPYGTHVAHVTVDPETGQVEIVRYVMTHDVGRMINPMIVQGQIIGAFVQGLGSTFFEDLIYDESGQLLTTTFMDYLVPTSMDVPSLGRVESIVLDEAPSAHNPLGVKGAGELGIIAPGGAISNAVSQALKRFRVHVTTLPLSPDNIRHLIREANVKEKTQRDRII